MATKQEKIIVALDEPQLGKAVRIAEEIGRDVGAFKVGLELITSEGAPQVVRAISKYGKIFFDGKFKDIPNTVAGAARAVARLGIWMFDVHCFGGVSMMSQAKEVSAEEAEKNGFERPLVVGVTILTSMSARLINEVGFEHVRDETELQMLVVRLSLLAKQAGLDGVVASPMEVEAIRKACGGDFLIVTPGVRPEWASHGDQKRVATPREAVSSGADFLVIGRPITNPPKEIGSPLSAIARIIDEI